MAEILSSGVLMDGWSYVIVRSVDTHHEVKFLGSGGDSSESYERGDKLAFNHFTVERSICPLLSELMSCLGDIL